MSNQAGVTDQLHETFETLPGKFNPEHVWEKGGFSVQFAIVHDRATSAQVLAVLWRRKGDALSEFELPTSMDFILDAAAGIGQAYSNLKFSIPQSPLDNRRLIIQR